MIKKHKLIISEFRETYGDLCDLKTHNNSLHTKIYTDLGVAKTQSFFEMSSNEFPILECLLPNNNYLLATTESVFSIYGSQKYEMKYSDYKTTDTKYFSKSSQIAEGKTRVFKYHLKNNKEFMYEIDSFYPADIIHNKLVLSMQFGKYDVNESDSH